MYGNWCTTCNDQYSMNLDVHCVHNMRFSTVWTQGGRATNFVLIDIPLDTME